MNFHSFDTYNAQKYTTSETIPIAEAASGSTASSVTHSILTEKTSSQHIATSENSASLELNLEIKNHPLDQTDAEVMQIFKRIQEDRESLRKLKTQIKDFNLLKNTTLTKEQMERRSDIILEYRVSIEKALLDIAETIYSEMNFDFEKDADQIIEKINKTRSFSTQLSEEEIYAATSFIVQKFITKAPGLNFEQFISGISFTALSIVLKGKQENLGTAPFEQYFLNRETLPVHERLKLMEAFMMELLHKSKSLHKDDLETPENIQLLISFLEDQLKALLEVSITSTDPALAKEISELKQAIQNEKNHLHTLIFQGVNFNLERDFEVVMHHLAPLIENNNDGFFDLSEYLNNSNELLARLFKKNPLLNQPDILPGLELTALLIALKNSMNLSFFAADMPRSNFFNSSLTNKDQIARLCSMERAFLKEISYDIIFS